jgi:hypothetical protein
MDTALGILLFVFVYGGVACIVYDHVAAEQSHLPRWLARSIRHLATNRPPTTTPTPVASGVN